MYIMAVQNLSCKGYTERQTLYGVSMIDIHAHILSGVDDGSTDLAASLEMLKIAVDNGTTSIIATPHIIEKNKSLSWSEIVIRTQELQQQATLSGLDIKIYAGAELEMNWDLLDLLKDSSDRPYCLAGSNYLLIELPGSMVPRYADEFLFEVKIRGMIPILAHPERHLMLMDDLAMLKRWKSSGVLLQCNAGSFTGLYGETAKRHAEYLLNEKLVDFIASDGHNTLHRNTNLSKCVRVIEEVHGKELVQQLFITRAEKILSVESGDNKQVKSPDNFPGNAIVLSDVRYAKNLDGSFTKDCLGDNSGSSTLLNANYDKASTDSLIEEIDEATLRGYLQRAKNAARISYEYTNCRDSLEKLELLANGRILNAARLMFGKNTGLEIQLAIFATDKRLTFNDIKRVDGNIMQLIDVAEKYIRNNIKWRVEFDGSMQRREVPEVPLDAVREALVNSFCHRDYTMAGNNEVSIYNNRIEIYSAGQFPEGLVPNDFIKGAERSIQRNPGLARILYYSRDVESFGTGLKRITESCRRDGVKVEFKMLKTGFLVTIYRRNVARNKKRKNKTKCAPIDNNWTH